MKGNEYIIYDKYAEMIINSKVHGEIKVLIDKEDIFKCKQITWHYSNSRDIPYICGKVKKKNIKLHRFLMMIDDKEYVIDHINRNTLDNRKSNLRVANYQQNNFNKSIRADNTTGVTGIDYNKRANKWRAKIKYNSINIHLGYFENLEDAIINRRIAEEYLFKEFRPNKEIISVPDDILIKAKSNVTKRILSKVS